MVTPASLYILRSFLKGSIETLVRQAFTLAACSCCAACCSALASPRPRPPPPPPPPRAPPGAGNHALGAVPRTLVAPRAEVPPGWRRAHRGRPARRPRPPAGPAPAAAATLRRRDPRVALDRPAHQLDGADARVEDVAERRLGALIGHAAIAVGDGADLHALDLRVGLPCAKAVKKSLPPSTVAAGTLARASFPNSRLLNIMAPCLTVGRSSAVSDFNS